MVPADCVLIQTELDTNEAFVKTAALDGERNLKPKMAIKQLAACYDDIISKPEAKKCPFKVESIPACLDMYNYEGRIAICKNDESEDEWFPLDLNQFLHRGCFLENSNWVVGLVVHTGE
jgi:phospholipid-translocating ATPase